MGLGDTVSYVGNVFNFILIAIDLVFFINHLRHIYSGFPFGRLTLHLILPNFVKYGLNMI